MIFRSNVDGSCTVLRTNGVDGFGHCKYDWLCFSPAGSLVDFSGRWTPDQTAAARSFAQKELFKQEGLYEKI